MALTPTVAVLTSARQTPANDSSMQVTAGRVMFTGDGHGDGIAVRTGRRGGACRRYRAVDDQRYRRTGAGAGQQAGGAVPRYGVGAVW